VPIKSDISKFLYRTFKSLLGDLTLHILGNTLSPTLDYQNRGSAGQLLSGAILGVRLHGFSSSAPLGKATPGSSE
jgi:hypothetical protein